MVPTSSNWVKLKRCQCQKLQHNTESKSKCIMSITNISIAIIHYCAKDGIDTDSPTDHLCNFAISFAYENYKKKILTNWMDIFCSVDLSFSFLHLSRDLALYVELTLWICVSLNDSFVYSTFYDETCRNICRWRITKCPQWYDDDMEWYFHTLIIDHRGRKI